MQNKPSNDQHKSIYYRLRRSDPHERLSARLRHFSFGAAVFFVVAAAGIVTHSLYNIQIKQGATFRQYAAQQQLLDSTIQATRGEIYDASGITLASTSVVWTIWADPSYSTALFTSQTVEETGEAVKTVDETTLADVSRQLTLRLLSGDGESLDSVDTSSAEYQTQYQTVHDALAKNGSSYQVLATKVNNAVKLSIEKYISEYNKDHAKAKTLEDGTAIKKGRVSVSSSKSFPRDYPYRRQRHHLRRQGRLQSGAVAGRQCAGGRGAVSQRGHLRQHGREPRRGHRHERQDRCHPCHGLEA